MDLDSKDKSLLLAGGFFFAAILLLVLFTVFYDFSSSNLGLLLFLITLISIVLLSKIIYDSSQTHQNHINFNSGLDTATSIESYELYTELYKNSPVPYLLINFAGEIISSNLAAMRFLGLKPGNDVGVSVFQRIRNEEKDHLDFIFEKYRNRISVSNETVQVLKLDDSIAWALLSIFQFNSQSGEHMGLLTLVDITKQKRIENAKTEFVSLASHQLRTPIAAIKWSAELLQLNETNNLTDRQKRYVDRLIVGTKRMAVLVDDFLRVSKFELGTFQPDYSNVDLIEVIEAVVSEQSRNASLKKILTKTFFDSSIDVIVTDKNLVRMIITNLYSNAIKYTKKGGTIHIGFGRKGQDVMISVADNGMGVPAEDQDRIFSKLFRAINAVRQVPDGNGLGLYVSKQAVEVLRGKISFSSVENVSTTFEVVLPLRLATKEPNL